MALFPGTRGELNSRICDEKRLDGEKTNIRSAHILSSCGENPLVDCGGGNYISSGIGPKGRTRICHVFRPGEKRTLCGEYALWISSIVRVLVFHEGWKNLTPNV